MDRRFRYRVLGGYYLLATALLTRVALSHSSDDSNTHVYNLLYLVTSMSMSYYFFAVLQHPAKKWVAALAGFSTLLYFVINTDEIFFDSMGHVIASTGIVILIFLYLHQVLSNVTEEPLSLNFDFWFVCVQLAYHLGSFAIFLSYNYFTQQYFLGKEAKKEIGTILTYLWVVHNVILFLSALIIGFGIAWIYRRKSLSS